VICQQFVPFITTFLDKFGIWNCLYHYINIQNIECSWMRADECFSYRSAKVHEVTRVCNYYYYYYYYYYMYSALGPVWAETRAQSGDWYGSGTLPFGQILRGSLPLLSPTFRRSNFRCRVPPRPPRRERSQRRKVELWARMLSGNFAEMTTSTPF
jgi:hypothetical protein